MCIDYYMCNIIVDCVFFKLKFNVILTMIKIKLWWEIEKLREIFMKNRFLRIDQNFTISPNFSDTHAMLNFYTMPAMLDFYIMSAMLDFHMHTSCLQCAILDFYIMATMLDFCLPVMFDFHIMTAMLDFLNHARHVECSDHSRHVWFFTSSLPSWILI